MVQYKQFSLIWIYTYGDGSQLTNITSTPNSAMISGSFEGGGSTNISGSLTSTGSFGSVVSPKRLSEVFGVSE